MIEVEIDKSVYLDCYHHLLEENEIDIELIWGGRDSGKSRAVAAIFCEEGMALDYMRGILIKKTHESIKDSQWQMMKDVAEDWKVDMLFSFKSSPLGISVINNNTFLTRGMDNAAKIRSITNPSHVWIEEGNQLTEEDFITILTSMRSNFGRVKMYVTFNPESTDPQFEDFWLYRMFFKNHYPQELSFTDELVMKILVSGKEEEVILKYRSTHVTYHQNPFVTPQRKAFLESLKESNYYWYQVFTLGLWGNVLNDNPYCYAFSRAKHTGKPLFNREEPLYISFDFNRNPMSAGVIQWYADMVKVLRAYKIPNSGVTEICNRILADYPDHVYIVNGDYSGNTASTFYAEEVSNFTIIKQMLKLSDSAIQITPNPSTMENRTLVNHILQYYDVEIHEEDAKPLIWDCENVRAQADGRIDKGTGEERKDMKKQADALDWFRYFLNKNLRWFLKKEDMITK